MDRPATNDRFRNAQRSLDSQEDPRFEAEHAEERAADLALSYRNDQALCREAAYLSAGTLGGRYYTDVQLALHQLHHTHPADLAGSDALTQLYRLARVEAEALDAKLLDLARVALADQRVAA